MESCGLKQIFMYPFYVRSLYIRTVLQTGFGVSSLIRFLKNFMDLDAEYLVLSVCSTDCVSGSIRN